MGIFIKYSVLLIFIALFAGCGKDPNYSPMPNEYKEYFALFDDRSRWIMKRRFRNSITIDTLKTNGSFMYCQKYGDDNNGLLAENLDVDWIFSNNRNYSMSFFSALMVKCKNNMIAKH